LSLCAVYAFNARPSQIFLDMAQTETEEATSNESVSTVYDCYTTEADYVGYVCKVCNGTYAYTVVDANASSLYAYTAEQQAQLQAIIDEYEAYVGSADYVAVAVDNSTCVSAYNIVNMTDKDALYENFTGRAYPSISHPEIFNLKEKDLSLNYLGIKHDGVEYWNYTEQSDTNKTGYSGTAEFQCKIVKMREVEAAVEVDYFGDVYYSEDEKIHSLPFNITIEEDREAGSVYTAIIAVNGTYSYQRWTNLIDSKAACSEVERPSNMSSLNDLEITYSELKMKTKEKKTRVKEAHNYFVSTSFAGGYAFYLYSDLGKVVIEPSDHKCYNAFMGNWTIGQNTYKATFLNKDDDYYVEARLYNRSSSLTLEEVQKTLVNKLYLDPRSIMPEYESRESAMGRALWPLEIQDPLVKVWYEGGTKIKVKGEGYLSTVRSEIEVKVSRVDGVVTGLTKVYQLEESVVLEADPAFERTEQHVMVASNPISFSEYPFMRPKEATDYSFVDVGYWYEVTLLMNDNCSSSHFCNIVFQHTNKKTSKINLRGSEDSDSTFLTSSLSTIVLETDLKFREDAFVYDFSTGSIFVVGAVSIQGDKENVLRFIGNITDVDTDAVFKVNTEELWASAFDIDTMTVGSLMIKANVSDNYNLTSPVAEGQAYLGRNCETEDSCSVGQIDIYFNQSNYQNNQFEARFTNMTAFEFFNNLCDYNYTTSDEVPYKLSVVDPSGGFTLKYAYPNNTVTDRRGFEVVGNVTYFEVPSSMHGEFRRLGSGMMRLSFNMSDFNAGSGNIKFKDPSGSITLDRSKNVMNEELLGTVTFASITQDTYFTVSSSGLDADMTGNPYGGLYEAEVLLASGAETSIEDAQFYAMMVIKQAQLADLENTVRQDLRDWIQSGLNALNQSRGYVEEAFETVSQIEPYLCVEKGACGERLECTHEPTIACVQSKVNSTCTEEGSSCVEQAYTCSESETICTITTDGCVGDDCCESSVVVCHTWSNTCSKESDDGCTTYKLSEEEAKCAREELDCGFEEMQDQSCYQKCQRNEYLYVQASENYESAQSGNNQTQADLQGFRSLHNVIQVNFEADKLVEFIYVAARRSLNETGLGPEDWTFKLIGKVIDLGTELMEDFSTTVKWDFFENEINRESLLNTVKAEIISRSKGEFTEALAHESPYEVVEANRANAN